MTTDSDNYTKVLYQKIKTRAVKKLIFAELRGSTLTYRQLLGDIERLITLFREHDLKTGSRVVIITRHDKEAMTLFIAALLEGLTPVILPPDTKSARAETIAKKVSTKMILMDEKLFNRWSWVRQYNAVPVLPEKQKPAALLGKFLRKSAEGASQYQGMVSDNKAVEPACASGPDDIAYILFSSGTTSDPKGILITHANLFTHLDTLVRIYNYGEKSRIFNNLSLAHADGMIQGPILTLFSGAFLFRPAPFTVQNLEAELNGVYSKRISHFITVPTVISLIDHLTTNDDYFECEDFNCIISVAAKLDKALWQRSEERFGVRICNIYGLTETVAGGVFCGPLDETFKIGTVGKAIDMEIKIVDTEGVELPSGRDGELWMKGANVTPGYFDDPEATSTLFSGPWLRTGDVARIDIDGFVEIVGRIKAIIMSGGFNIHPDEIDEVLMKHPSVASSATVGILDDDWGELVVSAVETTVPISEGELINHCRQYLEPIKVPKKIAILDTLPRGISGKVVLNKIREIFTNAESASIATSNGSDKIDIIGLAASVFKVEPDKLSLTSPAETVPGWDSLGHLELITAAEQKYAIEFGMNDMMSVNSLKRLLEIVQAKTGMS